MGWHCQRCGSGGTGAPRDCCGDAAVIAAHREAIEKRYGMSAQGTQSQGLLAQQRLSDSAAMAGAMQAQRGYWLVEQAKVVEKAVLPSAEELALALFETDPDVILFLDTVADSWDRHRGATSPDHGARYERARRIAWERDERGMAGRARRRAQDLLRVLEDVTAQPNGERADLNGGAADE